MPMGRRVLPWLLLAAACGLTHNNLQLLPGAEAQQSGQFPPATDAMRFLEGFWQGVHRYTAEDGTVVSHCVEQIIQRNGTAWQVWYQTEECGLNYLAVWRVLITDIECLPSSSALSTPGSMYRVKYAYVTETLDGVTKPKTGVRDCALARRNGDSLTWWDATDSTTTPGLDICPSVNAARTSVEKADAPESHTRISGGLPSSLCCTGCTTWTYTDNVVNAPRSPPPRSPPPPPTRNSGPYDPKGSTRDAGGSGGGLSTQGQKMLVIFLVPGCVFLALSMLVVLSALHKLRLKDSITARHARHTSPRPSSSGSGHSSISTSTNNTITTTSNAFHIMHGNTNSTSNRNGLPPGKNVVPAANTNPYLEPAVSARDVLTNGAGAEGNSVTTDNGMNNTASGGVAANGARADAATPAAAAAAAAADGARPHELTEDGEDSPVNWHWKTLVSDVFIWAALLTLLSGVAMPEIEDVLDDRYGDKVLVMAIGGAVFGIFYLTKLGISYWRLSKGYKITNYIARDAKRSPDAVVEAVTGLKAQEPVMAWSIDCWHYEMRTVTTWTSDANGNMYPVTSTVREKVTSFVGVEQLELSSWRDVTGDFSRLAHVSRFTRVKVLVKCIPEDEDAGRAWLAIRDRLVTQHGNRDAYYTVSSSVTVADKGEHTYMISGGNCFIEGLVSIPAYVASVLVCWDWLYLIWLQAMSHGVTIQLKKKYAASGTAV